MKVAIDTDQRQTLVPKLAKILASLKHQKTYMSGMNLKERVTEHAEWGYGGPEWIEQKLWLSLSQALAMDCRNRSRDSLSTEASNKHARVRVHQAPNLVTLGHVSSLPVDDSKLSQNMTIAADVAAGSFSPAGKSCTNLLGNMYQDSTWSAAEATFDDWLTGGARHAHGTRAVSHEAGTSIEIDMLEDMIGQKQLIHNTQSTFSCWQDQDPDLFESIDMYRDSRPSKLPLYQASTIETIHKQQTLFSSNQNINNISSSTTFRAIPDAMDSQNSMQSLSELLGDDSRLGNMWKRRRSTCPTGEDDAEQLHNMFLHDPDMKLFSPTRKDSSFADTMMFDNYDFSGASPYSSTSPTPSSYSRSSFEQLETSPYTCSTQSSGKKQFSSRKQSSRSRMSDGDILSQQASTSRSVDIKTRKNPREYSSRH